MAKQSRPSGRGVGDRPQNTPAVEALEVRRHLSASVHHATVGRKITPGHTYRPASDKVVKSTKIATAKAHTNYVELLPKSAGFKPSSASGPVGLTATQLRHAYGLDALAFNGVAGDGTGQTIAIITAYDDPSFVSSADPNFVNSDLHQFDLAMNLADPPSFTKLDQTGGTNYPAANASWAAEIALDVEWAHVMAPAASIVLVEANTNSYGDLIGGAVNLARSLPGVDVVSMSFGIDGGVGNESTYDPYFTTPGGHAGVTFLAATGDHGAVSNGTTYSSSYPAESPNVVAVGGTTLSLTAAGDYNGETAWVGSGGGISNYEAKPTYQSLVTTPSATKRATPDVAIDADPASGVAVYDSYNNPTPGQPWAGGYLGGTSLAAPLWAGLTAVADQARMLRGLGSLDGATQTLPRLYALPQSDFNDITVGNNRYDGAHGYNATSGYDAVTGRGSPVVASLLSDLSGGLYTGSAFRDINADGQFGSGDTVLSGVTVYSDANNNGFLDAGEVSAVTDASGNFTLDLPGGVAYHVRPSTPVGYAVVNNASFDGTTVAGATTNVGAFAYFPTAYAAVAGATNTFKVGLDASGTVLQVYVNSPTPTYTAPVGIARQLAFTGSSGDDTLTIDATNGNPLPGGGASFGAGTQNTGDKIVVVAPAGGTTALIGAQVVQVGGIGVGYSSVEGVSFVGGAGNDSVSVTGGRNVVVTGGGGNDTLAVTGTTYTAATDFAADGTAMTLTAGTGGAFTFNASQHLAALTLAGTGHATLAGSGRVIHAGTLSIAAASAAYLDLAANGLVVDGTDPAQVAAWVASGYAAGAWTGAGIRSSSAAADPTKKHTLGSGDAGTALGLTGSTTGTFLGEPVSATAAIVRYTLAGDTNLSGNVDFTDFLRLQSSYGNSGAFDNGDYNYDGTVNFSDFLMLQNDYGQTA